MPPNKETTMNIYLITEDGLSFCIRANSMAEAIDVCEKSYIEDELEEDERLIVDNAKAYYHAEILQSCALVAGLKN